MSFCPNCGAKVSASTKNPPAPLRKANRKPFATDFFVCPKCKTQFRTKAAPAEMDLQTANVKNGSERIRRIREELMQTLKELREKIQALEVERAHLLVEVETLRKAAETRAAALEGEVGQMREEAKSLRELLDNNAKPAPNKPDIQILPGSR